MNRVNSCNDLAMMTALYTLLVVFVVILLILLVSCDQEGNDISMVKSSSMGVDAGQLTHQRYGSLPGGTLDNATLGS